MPFFPSQKKLGLDIQDRLPALFLNGRELGFVNNYRYLGVNVDSHLSMNNHENYIVGKVRALLIYTLKKLLF